MKLSKNEKQKIYEQDDMLKGNIARMCLTNNYEELEMNYMVAKDRVETIYKIAHDHLHAEYDKEVSE